MTSPFPDWLVPMAATLTQDRFTGPEWIFERKFDGIRMIAFKNGADHAALHDALKSMPYEINGAEGKSFPLG